MSVDELKDERSQEGVNEKKVRRADRERCPGMFSVLIQRETSPA
jgi:hypothetical protein